jgi:hypothetical protein
MIMLQTPLWKRAEYLHKVAHSLKENSQVGQNCVSHGWMVTLLPSCGSPPGKFPRLTPCTGWRSPSRTRW